MSNVNWLRRASLLAALLALTVFAVAADEKDKNKDKDKKEEDREPDVVWVPSPQEVVDKMLEVAKVTEKDVVYDLGCGDGRIVCTAAKKYKCKAIGIDIDPKRIEDSEKTRSKLDEDIQKLVTIKKQDMFKVDLSDATVVTLYLLPELNLKLLPQLKKLKDGSRIVSHQFDMRGVIPDKNYPIKVKMKDGIDPDIYLWTTPLQFEKEKEKDKDKEKDKKDKDKDKDKKENDKDKEKKDKDKENEKD